MEWNIPHIRAICDPEEYRQQRWSTDQEAEMLHELTGRERIKNVIEIGTGYGFVTVCFAHAGATVQTFDMTDRPKVWNHPLWPWHELNAKITAKAVPSPACFFDCLTVPKERVLWFIDGDHSIGGAIRDLELVDERTRMGDLVVMHDALGEKGPRRAWRQYRRKYSNGRFEMWETKNGVGIRWV